MAIGITGANNGYSRPAADNRFIQTAGGTVTGNLTVTGTLSTTLLEALSANITVIDIKQYELSGFNVQGNATVQGSVSATGNIIGAKLGAGIVPTQLIHSYSASDANTGIRAQVGGSWIDIRGNNGSGHPGITTSTGVLDITSVIGGHGGIGTPLRVKQNSGSGGSNLQTWLSSNNTVLGIVDNTGRFGIGTGTPLAKLSIVDTTLAGSGALSGSALDISQTWNTTGAPTAIKLDVTDTTSNAASLLMDLQVGGFSRFAISKNGGLTFGSSINPVLRASVASDGAGRLLLNSSNISGIVVYGSTQLRGALNFFDGAFLQRDNVGENDVIAQRNSTNPQEFRLYGTYNNAIANTYERLSLKYDVATTSFQIGTEKGSIGGAARDLVFKTDGTERVRVAAAGGITASGTVTDTQPTDAATPVNAFTAATSTEAVFNAQKWSPVIKQSAKGWGTTASTSQDVSFSTIVKPTQSTVPTGTWSLQSSIAGGALTDQLTVTSTGRVASAVSFSAPIYYGVNNTGGILRLDGNAASRGLGIGSLNLVAWSSGAYAGGSVSGDTNLNRATTGGILQIGTTAANALGSLACLNGTFGGAINTFSLTVTGGTTFGEESLVQFDAVEYYYGAGAASAHRTALGLGATGSIAASDPLTVTQTWDDAAVTYTGLQVNVTDSGPSNAASLLMDLQVGGVSRLSVNKLGLIALPPVGGDGTGLVFGGSSISNARAYIGQYGVRLTQNLALQWSSSTNLNVLDLALHRDAANTLAQRNGTGLQPQAFRLYNTYTSSTNFERLNFRWDTNVAKIGTEKGSAGGTASDLVLETDGTERVRVTAAGGVTIGGSISASVGNTYDIGGLTGTKFRDICADRILQVGGGGSIRFEGRSRVGSQSDGLLRVSNSSESDFNRLQLGGTTSSFPAIKRTGSDIEIIKADGTAVDTAIILASPDGTRWRVTVDNTGTLITTAVV